MEKPTIKEIDAAAELFFDLGKKRKALAAQEKEAGEALCAVMRKHKVMSYRDDTSSLVVTRMPGAEKVRVAQVDNEEDDDESADEVN